jgi:hypothetical protein
MLPSSSINDAVRDGLQTQVAHASNLVNWATIAVAVGVALEGVELIDDAIAWGTRKRRENRERRELKELALIVPIGEIQIAGKPHSDHAKWVKRTLRIGLLLVVAGVVGEWRCGAKLEDAHNAVHQYDIAKLTAADQKAGEAETSAKGAAIAAGQAITNAGMANSVASVAQGHANEAKAGAADADRQVLNLKTQADSLKRDIAAEKEELREIRASRDIQDTMGFIDVLRQTKGTYVFFTVAQDADSLRIARLLNDLLKAAGWVKIPLPQQPLRKGYDPLAMNVFQISNPEEYIPPERFTTGIRIFINSPAVAEGEQRSIASLRKVWGDNPPSSVKPAEALARDLNERLFPLEHTTWGGISDEEKSLGYRPLQVLAIQGGATDVVLISVGPKPL